MARTAADLVLDTFVIGPESQGRGYQLLAPATLSFAGARDLAMILMEWSRTGERDFAGCLPLPGPQDNTVVFRAHHLGRQALGEAAFLNGVLVTSEDVAALGHRTELILEKISAPDGSTRFADGPVVVRAPAGPILPEPWEEGLGLAWHDRYIVVEASEEREDVLLRALASIDPPEQRPRVAAWVTSARLVSRGALDPLGQAQLIVGDAAAEDELPKRRRWPPAGGRPATAPESWTAWLRFRALFVDGPGFPSLGPALRWRPDYARLGNDEIAAEALRIATGVLAPDDMVELLKGALGGPFGRAAAHVAADYAEALGARGMATATLQRLWSASEQSAALTRALLRFAGNPIPRELDAALARACAAMRIGALADDEKARQGLTSLMKAAIASPTENIDILSEIIDAWPNSSKSELFSLTSHGSFEMMHSKSEIPAKRLSLRILRRDCYAFGVRGERGSVILDKPAGLQEALRAIATMRASACPD